MISKPSFSFFLLSWPQLDLSLAQLSPSLYFYLNPGMFSLCVSPSPGPLTPSLVYCCISISINTGVRAYNYILLLSYITSMGGRKVQYL